MNSDGKVDLIDIKAVVGGVGDVNGVKALMAFDYSLGSRVDLVMNNMAYAATLRRWRAAGCTSTDISASISETPSPLVSPPRLQLQRLPVYRAR